MCFGGSSAGSYYQPVAYTPAVTPAAAYTQVSETASPANGKTASQLDPMASPTSGGENYQAEAETEAHPQTSQSTLTGTGLTAGIQM